MARVTIIFSIIFHLLKPPVVHTCDAFCYRVLPEKRVLHSQGDQKCSLFLQNVTVSGDERHFLSILFNSLSECWIKRGHFDIPPSTFVQSSPPSMLIL